MNEYCDGSCITPVGQHQWCDGSCIWPTQVDCTGECVLVAEEDECGVCVEMVAVIPKKVGPPAVVERRMPVPHTRHTRISGLHG